MDFRETVCDARKWIYLAQVRVHLQVLVNSLMNFRVLYLTDCCSMELVNYLLVQHWVSLSNPVDCEGLHPFAVSAIKSFDPDSVLTFQEPIRLSQSNGYQSPVHACGFLQ